MIFVRDQHEMLEQTEWRFCSLENRREHCPSSSMVQTVELTWRKEWNQVRKSIYSKVFVGRALLIEWNWGQGWLRLAFLERKVFVFICLWRRNRSTGIFLGFCSSRICFFSCPEFFFLLLVFLLFFFFCFTIRFALIFFHFYNCICKNYKDTKRNDRLPSSSSRFIRLLFGNEFSSCSSFAFSTLVELSEQQNGCHALWASVDSYHYSILLTDWLCSPFHRK